VREGRGLPATGPHCYDPKVISTTAREATYSGRRGFGSTTTQEVIRPMTRIQSILATLRREAGQGLAEYALILALIAIVAIVALLFLGGQISAILSTIGASI